jgi:hypothetical protein
VKINLTANSLVSLPDKLSIANIDYGYSFGPNIEDTLETNPWKKSILQKIDKAFSYFRPISEQEKLQDTQVVSHISNAAIFLNSQGTEEENHLDGMSIQINLNSSFNKFLQLSAYKVANALHKSNITPHKSHKILDATNTNLADIFTINKRIRIGSNCFFDSNHICGYLASSIGLEKSVNQVVFHEASHAFQLVNEREYFVPLSNQDKDKESNVINRLIVLSQRLSNNDYERYEIDNSLRDNPTIGVSSLDAYLLNEIATLQSEIYADVGSALLQRNKDFKDNTHTLDGDMSFTDAIIDARIKEQTKHKSEMSTGIYVSNFNHFTAPGLEHLKDLLPGLPNRQISQEELHNIAKDCIIKGLSRILISNVSANNVNVGQLKVLFNIGANYQGFFLNDPFNDSLYLKQMTILKYAAGTEWTENFVKNLEKIKELKMQNPKEATWHAGTMPKIFVQDVKVQEQLNKDLDELFFDMPIKSSKDKKTIVLPIETNPSFTINKSEHLMKIRSIQEKMSEQLNTSNSLKI